MPTMVYVLVAVSCVLLAICLLVLRRVSSRLASLQNERDEIVGEEMRMFEFLHHLGSVIEKDISPALLHKEIVEGLCEVLAADGGAIYILDESGDSLIPKYLSKHCPPIVGVPVEIRERAKEDVRIMENHIRLSKVSIEEGVLGAALAAGESLSISAVKDHPSFRDAFVSYEENVAALVAPLQHAGRDLGAVAVIKRHEQGQFSENDFMVFKSVAEQSSFAMGNAMIHQEVTEKRKLEDELRTARDVQNILLPSREPNINGYRIIGSNTPARIVSGDYFDFMNMKGNKTGVVIADVSGKGVPAGLLMAMCRSLLRSSAISTDSPAEALATVNRQLFPDVREDMFVSLACLTLDDDGGDLRLARAGHDAPLLYRHSDQTVETLKPPGVAIGIDEGTVFERVTKDVSLSLNPGDCILLYTDGVCEAVNASGEEFGKERLQETFLQSAATGARSVVDTMKQAVKHFSGDQPQLDDITLIAIEKR